MTAVGLVEPQTPSGAPVRRPAEEESGDLGIYNCHFQRYTMVMSKRLVDIDDDLLEAATAILGASTMKETVNRSLETVVLAARRHRHADRLAHMRDLDLADPVVMAGAWR